MLLMDRIIIIYWRAVIYGFAFVLAAGALPAPGLALEYERAVINNMLIAYPSAGAGRAELHTEEEGITGGLYSIGNREKLSYSQSRTIDKKVIRDFALFNFSRLSNDIVYGSGLYLETLFTLLKVDENDRSNVRQDFVNILIRSHRIPEFAMEIAEYDRRK
jgi:hypothetical protein